MTEEHFGAVVVGSGFGGSVSAYRLATADPRRRVCVLERGKAYPPGSFARRPREMAANFWDPSRGLQGLFDVWSFRRIEALVSAGLGGGSLIYANVLLPKDPSWFVHDLPGGGTEPWPIGYDDLAPHYETVRDMIGASPYPFGYPPYSSTGKTLAMQDAAIALGREWGLPNLAVTFADGDMPPTPGVPLTGAAAANLHGAPRSTCRLCGECDMGCNYGSKNTLDLNYLSAAVAAGAEIRTRCEVHTITPAHGGGYRVTYGQHTDETAARKARVRDLPPVTVTCDNLILAAGSLGTTYLLLANQANLGGLGPHLGTRWCGNGDLLGFVLGIGTGPGANGQARVIDSSRGPVITSYLRLPDRADGGAGSDGPGAYIEDAGHPIGIDWLVEAAHVPGFASRGARFVARRAWSLLTGHPRSDIGGEVAAFLGKAQMSSASLGLLGMGRDTPDGVLSLRRGYLQNSWSMETSKDYFDRVRDTMRDMAGALGGRYRNVPLRFLKRVITVHPLGGCPMGGGPADGVVDTLGQVFGHPGLYVADGSVMPGPIGPNPALTIAAFANRMCDSIIGEGVTGEGPAGPAGPAGP